MGAIIDKIKGKLMKTEGKVTGDKVRQAQGTAVETKGKVKAAVERGVAKAKGKATEIKSRAKAATRKTKRKAAAARYTP